jgi:Transglutaminase-like superfamily
MIMGWIRRFFCLKPRDRFLLVHAASVVAVLRLGLWILPFQVVRRALRCNRSSVSAHLASMPVRRLAWAVQAAARRIPRASCLTQALALQYLLARAGHHAQVRIGVAKKAPGLESHAWLEFRGEVLVGDSSSLKQYSPILSLRPEEI